MPDHFRLPWASVPEEFRRFRRDLPKLVALAGACGLAGLVWMLVTGESAVFAVTAGAAIFAGMRLLAPVLWADSWRRIPRPGEFRRWGAATAVVAAWFVLVVALLFGVLAALDALGPR